MQLFDAHCGNTDRLAALHTSVCRAARSVPRSLLGHSGGARPQSCVWWTKRPKGPTAVTVLSQCSAAVCSGVRVLAQEVPRPAKARHDFCSTLQHHALPAIFSLLAQQGSKLSCTQAASLQCLVQGEAIYLEASWQLLLPEALQHGEEGGPFGVEDHAVHPIVGLVTRLDPQAVHRRQGVCGQSSAVWAFVRSQQFPCPQQGVFRLSGRSATVKYAGKIQWGA